MHFLINTATCKVIGEVLCEPVCVLCFSSLLYKYRITVLFHKLNSSCVSHVKKGAIWQFLLLHCQYILQLNRLFTVKWLECLCQKLCLLINRKSYINNANNLSFLLLAGSALCCCCFSYLPHSFISSLLSLLFESV